MRFRLRPSCVSLSVVVRSTISTMKQTFLIISFLWVTLSLSAQNPLLDSLTYVTIEQDTAITKLLTNKILGAQSEAVLVDGFRVQIYSSNIQKKGKEEAIALEKYLAPLISVPVYVTYISPSWKVRVGDFLTFDEAQAYKNELVQQFPQLQASSYVIGDQIRIMQ